MTKDSEVITLHSNSDEDYEDMPMSISRSSNNQTQLSPDSINWLIELQKGDFMPAVIMLENHKIKINDEIYLHSGITLLHVAINYGFYNVIRALIEIYNANVNAINFSGHTPLHLLCCHCEQNIYILSYFLKNPHIDISIRDSSYLTPVFYAIINHFHYAMLSFLHLNHDVNQCDSLQNKLLYFAIVNNNKFALDYIINNSNTSSTISQLLNVKYYNNTSSLSDIIITNKNNDLVKHLLKNYHQYIDLDSISSCKKNKLSFPFYNMFTYELLNTVYFYKCGHYLTFIKALIFNYKAFYNTSTYILQTKKESNGHMCYHYKSYMFYFMIYHMYISNMSSFHRVFIFSLYLIIMLLLTVRFIGKIGHDTMIIYATTFILYAILYKMNSIQSNIVIENQNEGNLSKEIYDDLVGNVFQLPNIEEVCAICSIRKGIQDNHCYKCNRCIVDFYFHSIIFNWCIHRKNAKCYIMFLMSLMMLLGNIIYAGEYETFTKSNHMLIINILMIINKGEWKKILFEIFAACIAIILLGKVVILIICVGTNVSYYNMFRYNKGQYGKFQDRKKKRYVKIPQVYFVSFKNFIQNLFC